MRTSNNNTNNNNNNNRIKKINNRIKIVTFQI